MRSKQNGWCTSVILIIIIIIISSSSSIIINIVTQGGCFGRANHHHHRPEGVVHGSSCLDSRPVAASKVPSGRWRCIESLSSQCWIPFRELPSSHPRGKIHMCVYIYIYIHMCMYVYIYIYTHIRTHIYIYIYIYTHVIIYTY